MIIMIYNIERQREIESFGIYNLLYVYMSPLLV